MPLSSLADEVRIAVGMNRDEAVTIIQKHGGRDITSGLAVVGPKGEYPLSGIYWEFRDLEAVITLAGKDGKVTAMTFWTKKDFAESKSHRAKTEQNIRALRIDTRTRAVSIDAELSALGQVFERKESHPTSATLKQCPDGHTELKDVPIVYGTPPFDGPAAKQWEEKIRNFEMWSGGCVRRPDSPKTCIECGFGYDSRFRHWSRDSADPTTFKRTFSPLIASFPKPTGRQQKGELEYSQTLSTNQVIYQSVSFTSAEPRKALIARINAWLSTNNIAAGYTEMKHTVTFNHSKKIISEWEAKGIGVMMQHMKKTGDSWVLLHLSNQ
jgi:hypothetical protein